MISSTLALQLEAYDEPLAGSQKNFIELKQSWKGLRLESTLQVNRYPLTSFENTCALLERELVLPVERQASEVPEGGKPAGGDPFEAQPQTVILVLYTYLIILDKDILQFYAALLCYRST